MVSATSFSNHLMVKASLAVTMPTLFTGKTSVTFHPLIYSSLIALKWYKQVEWTIRFKFYQFVEAISLCKQRSGICLPVVPRSQHSAPSWLDTFLLLHENSDCYALLNIEDILIFTAVRSNFFFLGVAMKIKNINIGESIHQRLPHATESGVI